MYELATRNTSKHSDPLGSCRFRAPHVWLAVIFSLISLPALALSVTMETTPAGELFPALELSQHSANGLDPDQGSGLLRIHIGSVRMPRDIQLTVSTPGLRQPTQISQRITGDITLRPRLNWDAASLLVLKQPRRQTLRVRLAARGMQTIEREFEVRVHPLDEALYFVREGDARIDLGWAFAAWVDPQDPVIDDLLNLAGIDPDAVATSTLDRAARVRLARSLWVALERRGLRYADEGAGVSQGPVIYTQRVRLLSDTWDERVANCLDGSVLIASALERLGIGSLLVLVPGHAFVGFYADHDRGEAEFLETTLLGFARPAKASAETIDHLGRRAGRGFDAARKAGRKRYKEAQAKLDGRHRPDYALIDISTARAYGIMPLAVGHRDRAARAPVAATLPAVPSSPTSQSP